MELLERYLQAVRFFLPKDQREDVVRELSEELRSQIEEQEGEQGRPLDEAELAALLKRFGHPMLLALRYQQGRYLIGPAIFPLYWFAVKSVLGILAIVHILLPGIFFLVTQTGADKVVGLFLRFPGVAVEVLAWMTLGFAVLETGVVRSAIERTLSSFRPQSLPPLLKEKAAKPPSVAELALGALMSAWWLVGLKFPVLLLGPAADYIGFGPTFHRLYIPMAVAAAAGVVLGCLRLSRPHWTRSAWVSDLVVDGMGLVLLYLLSRGGEWIVAGPRLAEVSGAQGVVELANLGTGLGLTIALVVSGLAFAWKYLMFVRWRPWRGGATPPRTT
jgi:hypothetical protein